VKWFGMQERAIRSAKLDVVEQGDSSIRSYSTIRLIGGKFGDGESGE